MRKFSLILLSALLFLVFAIGFTTIVKPARSAPSWQDKVDSFVLQNASASGEAEFLVLLAEQADLSQADHYPTKLQKGQFVYQRLVETARRTQPPVITELEQLGVPHRSYWIANMIWVRGNMEVVQRMAARSDVGHVYANPHVRMSEPLPPAAPHSAAPAMVEWNISKVNAPKVWAEGVTGEGIVIGGQDTGYYWQHAAIKNQYRGWDGKTADHNYNWHDAIHTGDGSCGADSPEPCDDHGHGTHTMGTMVGDDGGSNQIGMAPGARWIGCRNMDVGVGTPETYSECFQWFLAPTDLNDENPDVSKAPHVINNSWACPATEGCTDPGVLQTVVENTRAAGIVVVASAGNSGRYGCETVQLPPAIYDASFSVGATNSSDNIADFSSRGPVTIDGSSRLKPDIVAPGVGIRSATHNGSYGFNSGTSMAGPHVAGLIALLIDAGPGLAGQVDTIESIITDTAMAKMTTENCGDVPGTEVPNNTYGYGRIDADAAYNNIPLELRHDLVVEKQASATEVSAGELLTYTLTVTHEHPVSLTHQVVLTDVLPVGTTFITATVPFTLDGGVIEWQRATMAPDEAWQVSLVVEADPPPEHLLQGFTIENITYGVRSIEVQYRLGMPVAAHLTVNRLYFPALFKEQILP